MNIFSEDAMQILKKRYLLKDSEGEPVEEAEGMLRRVAEQAALVETDRGYWNERFFSIMFEKRFLPNSPTLANAGRPQGQLAACFVLPVPDSIEGIFETMKNAAIIHKTGGGTGFSFSQIRPKDDPVGSTGGLASGPVPFIRAFNCATEAIKQGGMRRGANMAVLDYRHPDIFDFISLKEEEGGLTNFNLSVGVDHSFMTAIAGNGNLDFVNPRNGKKCGQPISANLLLDRVVEAAWTNGEPGMLFFDHINDGNTVPGCGPLTATNPCGEQPLFDWESCNLGSLNLTCYVKEEGTEFRERIDWSLLGEDVATAVRFLDNIIDVNYYVFKEVEQITRANRKIGLGVMGFADLLIELEIPYASFEAIAVIEELMGFIQSRAMETSSLLAYEKGNFSNIDKSIFRGSYRRNATLTTIAPTGTLSMLTDVSSGIEPLFGLSYMKEVLEGRKFTVTNQRFERAARKNGFWSQDLVDEVLHSGTLKHVTGISEDFRQVFATALEISPEWHIRVQAAFQRYVDNAVSKTVNFPATAAKKDIRAAYIYAWQSGCKGLTIYRTGSRKEQVLTLSGVSRSVRGPENCPTCS